MKNDALGRLKVSLNANLKELCYNYAAPSVLRTHPRVHAIEVTNFCNLDCAMCPRRRMKRKLGFMDLGLFRKIAHECDCATEQPWLHLWGESMTHPDIIRMIEYAAGRSLRPSLSSNVTFIKAEHVEALVRSGLFKLIISIDAASEETYRRVRRKGRFSRVVENAHRLLDARARTDSPLRIVTQLIQMKANEEEVEAFRDYWLDAGADAVYIKGFGRWGRQRDRWEDLDPEPTGSTPDAAVVCRAPWDSVVVLWDGRVSICCFDYDGKMVMGNVGTESLWTIWNSRRYWALRQSFLAGDYANPLCANCNEYAQLTGAHRRDPLFLLRRALHKARRMTGAASEG